MAYGGGVIEVGVDRGDCSGQKGGGGEFVVGGEV